MFMYKCPVCDTYWDVITVYSPEYFGYYTVCTRCGRHTAVFEDPDTAFESWKNGESSTEYSRVPTKRILSISTSKPVKLTDTESGFIRRLMINEEV